MRKWPLGLPGPLVPNHLVPDCFPSIGADSKLPAECCGLSLDHVSSACFLDLQKRLKTSRPKASGKTSLMGGSLQIADGSPKWTSGRRVPSDLTLTSEVNGLQT